jgi:molecular chaperone GrpE
MVTTGEKDQEGEQQPAAEARGTSADGGGADVRSSLTELTGQLAREHDRAQARERVIDRLHSEVERLRTGEVRSLLRPAVTDLRRLRDDLTAQARSVPDTMKQAEVAALLESYADSVLLILERCGIVPVRPDRQTRLDTRQQQVAAIVATSQPELDGTIAEAVSDGYAEADTGKLVAPARVTVYRLDEGDPSADQAG